MKVKTSITLSEGLLQTLDEIVGDARSRSDFIEEALREFLKNRIRKVREAKDLKILNEKAEALNEEAEEVLAYQVEL